MIDTLNCEYWLDTPLKGWQVRLRSLRHFYEELQAVEAAGIKYTLETDIMSLGMLFRIQRESEHGRAQS